ncbi:hypothetical protein VHEMI04132 [[Torrubiella] hemipterigena]|uniref:Zn(2)-C6 fungal-type domain-containing protein n=1 Tax=[Torrubiella] hemipterigena TaxID=1531966 RepID=A0A0A1SUJ8_9HYPO|nr:hypothetical protein VHEMI04132 [[Torrubiella] hemipterigena]
MSDRQLSQGTSNTKRRRVTRACDFCHRRSIGCRPSDSSRTCQNCKDFGHQCTYHREPRRRGVQPRASSRMSSSNAINTERNQQAIDSRNDSWRAPRVASQAVIVDLIDVYFEIVYPIFPIFHQPSFTRRISRAEYMHDRALFIVVMAMCALVSRRIRDGAVSNPQWDLLSLQAVDTSTFMAHATAELASQKPASDLNTLRAHAILAITSIQTGNIKDMHFHLGLYHTLVAMDMLHDESNWPKGINAIEREERRRLFWSIYTLDIYTSVVWGGIVRCHERQSRVAYPMEIDDESLTDETADQKILVREVFSPTALRRHDNTGISVDCWVSGWNFVTDLYRVLEHALARFHRSRNKANYAGQGSLPNNIFLDESCMIPEASVADLVLQLYLDLPSCYKETPDMSFHNTRRDRIAFQAANITATLQLVRIVLLATSRGTVAARCQIAREVLDSFASIPVTYLLAISTPLLHHLGGIGSILGSVLDEPCTGSEYRLVQSIMLSMAELLENLQPIQQGSGASQSLREKASQITALIQSHGHLREADSSANEQQSGDSVWPAGTQGKGQFDTTREDPLAQVQLDLLNPLAWNFDFGQYWN